VSGVPCAPIVETTHNEEKILETKRLIAN
jgi:hypothetical protein